VNEPQPISILLVEDDPGDVLLVREAFEHNKVSNELRVAADGVYALAQLRDPELSLPDIVLLDLNLPRKDGREVLAEIRGDPRLTAIPVVILTTSDAEADVLRSYELHANAYVTKPVDLSRFLAVLREIDNFFVTVVKLPGRGRRAG
jgi:CheY-like chemotaxis protein